MKNIDLTQKEVNEIIKRKKQKDLISNLAIVFIILMAIFSFMCGIYIGQGV